MAYADKEADRASLWNKIVSGLVGIGGGYLAAYNTVRGQFDHDMKHSHHHATLHDKHAGELGELTEAFIEPEIWAQKKEAEKGKPLSERKYHLPEAPADLETYTKLVTEAKARHAHEYNSPLEKRGIASSGIEGHTKGFVRKFRLMGPDSKWATVFNAGLSTAIAAGATYTFLGNIHTRHEINKLKDRVDAHADGRESSRA